MSDEAKRLNGGPRYLFYAEFDTTYEAEAWREYIYDPLRMLMAEGVPLPNGEGHGHLGINILKLEESEGVEPSDNYVAKVTERGNRTTAALEEFGPLDASQREHHITTTVINAEIPLNPRIGTTYA
jgi:hypothetical protein